MFKESKQTPEVYLQRCTEKPKLSRERLQRSINKVIILPTTREGKGTTKEFADIVLREIR
jgi:hypothetical protein